MHLIENDSFIKEISEPINNLLAFKMYSFRFNKENQSIYVQDNQTYVLTKNEIQSLIKGLQNSLESYPEEEFNQWNTDVDEKNQGEIEFTNKNENHMEEHIFEKHKKKGYVYFMQDNSGFVKIGLAADVRKRFKAIHSSNPTVKLLYHIKTEDMELTERLFHEFFDKKRVNGEWFNLTEKDLKYIKAGRYPKAIMDSIGRL